MRRLTIAAVLATALIVPLHAQELSGTLKKIKDSGAITLGIRDSAVPFSYIDDKQKIVGYAVDICMKIVDEIKTELKLDKLEVNETIVTSSTRIPLMANGTVDLECGSTTNNADRQKQVWFTNTHFLTASRFVSKKALKLDQVDDLKGKAVVSVAGTTNINQLTKANVARSLGITIMSAKDVPEAFLMVETDRAQAFVMDDIQLAAMIASSKDPSLYAISNGAFSDPEPYGIMLRKDDTPFKTVVDRATAKLYQSPEIEKIYNKWFNEPVPPRGLNFHVPMPAALKKSFEHPSDNPDPASYAG
ncbi:amino acid ABC transporter substrate-binding protein [Bradyrhizobium sp. INPA01-394B]|uniref:Amino acid ABC transporter substrate-binding protein n=1 Tax=Bradyrhizobium campsiandrae TaxID=1729892 RepID=A0ABR7U7H7_9BRAD|nr:amino acid ABC transporter substrate-binding protein [Bradyrhizobium campsiandrae]MBC9881664.1 amino acid ABC transporter substrate-binding protein [Bradyrhizobium campsiandrae]MBC9979491.1 amino acid ABC transporter substrate-binding protein [Bradyrhizobium campsiandrae]